MAPPVGGVRSTDPHSYSGVDSSEETTFVQVGETSLAQVAQRLQLDANDLLAANPQFQELVARSKRSPRKPFFSGEQGLTNG